MGQFISAEIWFSKLRETLENLMKLGSCDELKSGTVYNGGLLYLAVEQ